MTTALPEVSDASFANTPERRVGDAVVPLPAYQWEALNARARIKVYKWCRQAGKDFIASLEGALGALSTKQDWFIVSLTERQSLATFEKVKMHLRAFGVVLKDLAIVDEQFGYRNKRGDWCVVNSKKAVLPGGGSITALPGADPDAIVGLTGNVIFTELALFDLNGSKGVKHWRTAFPLITRGFRIIAISTPRGHDTKFAALCRNPKYWVSEVDIHRACADGLDLRDNEDKPITPSELEELYGDPAGWTREYLVQESDDLDALVAWRYLELAKADYEAIRIEVGSIDDYNPERENVFAKLDRKSGPLYVGWDVARKAHLSPVWVNQLVGDVFHLRVLINMHKMDFPYMRRVLWQAMDISARGAGDATGLGMESCEATAKRYPGRFDEVNFSSAKGALGSKLMQTYEDVRQRFPEHGCDDIAHDLHALQKEIRLSRLILHENKNPVDSRSHCDMAYANALALFAAAEGWAGPVEALSAGKLAFAKGGLW